MYDEIVESFETINDVKIDSLKGAGKRGYAKEMRDQFICEVIEYKSLTQTEVSRFLGVSLSTVSKIWCNR